jgi:hypothetical protein
MRTWRMCEKIYAPKKNVQKNLCAYYTKFGHSCRQNLSVSGEYAKRISAYIENAHKEFEAYTENKQNYPCAYRVLGMRGKNLCVYGMENAQNLVIFPNWCKLFSKTKRVQLGRQLTKLTENMKKFTC